jgi:uncharacterized protein (TIGR00369 family)
VASVTGQTLAAVEKQKHKEFSDMSKESHYRKLENMMHSAPFVELTGARARIDEGSVEIVIPVREALFHAAGAVHGALYFLALDNAAFFAVNSIVEDVFVLTTSFNIYLTRPVSKGEIRAVGKLVHRGGRQFIAESVLHDSEGKEIARGSGVFVKSKIPLTEKIGYRQ